MRHEFHNVAQKSSGWWTTEPGTYRARLVSCRHKALHREWRATEPGAYRCLLWLPSVPEPSSLAGSEVLKCSGAVVLGRSTVRCLSGPLSLAGKYVGIVYLVFLLCCVSLCWGH